jgi:hypothetical protein
VCVLARKAWLQEAGKLMEIVCFGTGTVVVWKPLRFCISLYDQFLKGWTSIGWENMLLYNMNTWVFVDG